MLGEAIMGLGAIKTAFDMAKGLKDIDDTVRRNAAVIELQENILTAQQAQAALIKRIDYLKKEVAGFETWEAEKMNYELKSVHIDTFAYARKSIAGSSEPSHFICANCYEQRKKRILQRTDMAHLACPE
jgi:CII-binding regulator of phage lambda lysogenization HflD